MVIPSNLSAYEDVPPNDGEDRKIINGPLYPLARIQALAETPDGVFLWTRKCGRDVSNLGWDTADVADRILELREKDYRDSEWCENGKGRWAACDAYSLRRTEYQEYVGKNISVEYFLKFAESKTGKLVLIISCHT